MVVRRPFNQANGRVWRPRPRRSCGWTIARLAA